MSDDPNDLTSPIDEGVTAEDLGRVLFIGVGGVGIGNCQTVAVGAWPGFGLPTAADSFL